MTLNESWRFSEYLSENQFSISLISLHHFSVYNYIFPQLTLDFHQPLSVFMKLCQLIDTITLPLKFCRCVEQMFKRNVARAFPHHPPWGGSWDICSTDQNCTKLLNKKKSEQKRAIIVLLRGIVISRNFYYNNDISPKCLLYAVYIKSNANILILLIILS